MKSNWLTYVAITASLIAGFLCSTAFADNKGGMKFSGGGSSSIRSSFSGGTNGGSQMRTMQLQQNNNVHNNLLPAGTLHRTAPTFGGVQNGGTGISGIIKTPIKSGQLNGNLGQVLGGTNGNSGVVGRTPQIKINPGTITGNGNGQGTVSGLNGIKIGNNGIKIGGSNNTHGLGITLGNGNAHNTINKQCHIAPKCIDPCFNKGCSPCGNKCGPCLKNWNPLCQPWWWTCHTHYCNQPIYYPVYTTPILVAVPVVVGVPVIEERLVQVPVGSTITMQALGLGDVAGRMILVMDKVSLESQLVDWNAGAVTATLPMFALAAPVPAELVIVKGDGQPATSMKIELIPAQPAAQQVGGVQQAQFSQPAGELSAAAALVQ